MSGDEGKSGVGGGEVERRHYVGPVDSVWEDEIG